MRAFFEGKFDLACITNKRGGLGGGVGGWFNFMTAQTKIKVSKTKKGNVAVKVVNFIPVQAK